MSTPIDSSIFVDIADAIGLGNPAIVEKDYYVVQLLQLISVIEFEYHRLVFTGGTALAKSTIKTFRMSEDIDIKLVPNQKWQDLTSRSAKRKTRKSIEQYIESLITTNETFSIEGRTDIKDEYRYFSFDIRYPQMHLQSPCLRPFIKLEFIESNLLGDPEPRNIQSIYSEVLNTSIEVNKMACAAIIETQAEKILSILRRTASAARNSEREDDDTLIRHIYDTYHIQQTLPSDIDSLSKFVARAIELDNKRFANQHPEMVSSPIEELRFGLQLLNNDPKFLTRYERYVTPMVYAEKPVSWVNAIEVFTKLTKKVLDYIECQS